jgi:serine/threonine protein kinase
MSAAEKERPRSIGRYVLFQEVAHGGMATVHMGRLRGPAGFARTVAIKRLHPPFARDPEFVSMFLDEARLAARIQHPNVVSVLDVVASEGELFLVMDYVHGESLSKLLRLAGKQNIQVPRRIIATILVGVLNGLDAAHEARSEAGDALEIVHRDVSPQNVLLGLDGSARVLDFGVAKASLRIHWSSRDGQLKGKLGYMAPEQVTTGQVDRRADIYAVGVMLWEGLTGKRLFDTKQGDIGILLTSILNKEIDPPSKLVPNIPKALDTVAMKALSRNRDERFPTARAMAEALERSITPTTARQVGEWVNQVAGATLRTRAAQLAQVERAELPPPPSASDHRNLLPIEEESGSDVSGPQAKGARSESDTQVPRVSVRDLAMLVPTPAPIPRERLANLIKNTEPTQDDEDVPVTSEPDQKAPPPPAVDDRTVPQTREEMDAIIAPAKAEDVPSPLAMPPLLWTWARAWPGAAVVAVLLLLWIVWPSRRAPALAVTPTADRAPVPASLSLPPLSAIPPPPPDTATAAAEPPTPPSPPSLVSTIAPARATVATTIRAITKPAPPRPKIDCNPPYTVDAQGVRIPKRQCF